MCSIQLLRELHKLVIYIYIFRVRQPLVGLFSSLFRFRVHNHTTFSRIPLDEWSAVAETSTWQHTTLKRHAPKPSPRFDPAIPSSERPHTHSLNRHWAWSHTLSLPRFFLERDLGSVVGTKNRPREGKPMNRGSIRDSSKRFILSQKLYDRLWGQISRLF
jgi:hypothetical protein